VGRTVLKLESSLGRLIAAVAVQRTLVKKQKLVQGTKCSSFVIP
jgi:hypothetical protein